MYVLSAFTSINTPKTPLNMVFNRKYFFFEQGLRITSGNIVKKPLPVHCRRVRAATMDRIICETSIDMTNG